MSLSQDALSEGFDNLQDNAGEPITFRSAALVATIDRTPVFTDNPQTGVNFAARGLSVIDLRATDVAALSPDGTAPRTGEYISENSGAIKHRIEKVYPRPGYYTLHCTVTQ